MSTATCDDEDQRTPLLKSFAQMRGDMVDRADQAVRDGARYVPPKDAPYEDVTEALRAAGLLDGDQEQIDKHFRDPEGHYRWGVDGWTRVDSRDPETEILPPDYEVVQPDKIWFAISAVHLDRMREFVGQTGFVTYWPRQVKLRIRGRGDRKKRTAVATPLFQRYVLVHMPATGTRLPDIITRAQWLDQLRCHGGAEMVRGRWQDAEEVADQVEAQIVKDKEEKRQPVDIGQPYRAPFGKLTTHQARFNGVGDFLANAAGPVAIADQFVSDIVRRERAGEFDATSRKGKRRVSKLPDWCFLSNIVRVAAGPFASFPGAIEEIDEIRERLKVAVMIFGRATPVDLAVDDVESL